VIINRAVFLVLVGKCGAVRQEAGAG